MKTRNEPHIISYDEASRHRILIEEDDWLGEIVYYEVTPTWSTTCASETVKIHNFLYEGYAPCLKPMETFHEIRKLKVTGRRREHHGTDLFNMFMEYANPTSIILSADVLDMDLYKELCRMQNMNINSVEDYILREIVPFWESLGFRNMRSSAAFFSLRHCVPMIYPAEKAELLFDIERAPGIKKMK